MGYVAAGNTDSPDKIGWNQSSRTDKGVHSAATMFSAKLELSENQMNYRPEQFDAVLAEQLNAELPSDIRALYCSRVSSGFYPRKEVGARKYEYLIPLKALKRGKQSLERLEHVLTMFRGTQNVHNFGIGGGDKEEDEKHRNIFQSYVTILGGQYKDFFCVTLNGSSFMRSQIRRMIGTALTVANGQLDEDYFELALKSDVEMPTHMAPSHTLVLSNFMLTNPDLQDQWYPLQKRQDEYLMNVIYPHILELEQTSQDGFDKFLGESTDLFLEHLHKNYNLKELKEQARESALQKQQKKEANQKRHNDIVQRHINALMPMSTRDRIVYKQRHHLWANPKEVFQQGFLAELSARYNILPFTRQTSQMLYGLAMLISEGKLPPVQHHDVYFNYLDTHGIRDVIQVGKRAEKLKDVKGLPFIWSP